jgi:sporulation protein YlmC with PRC-barrel domain
LYIERRFDASRSIEEEHIMTTVTGHTSAIRAKKVIGTSVKDPSGAAIGKVEDIVLDKLSNNIMFAIVGFGGFLGMGEKFHPLPWSTLDYDDTENGYVVSLTKEELEAAPAYSMEELTQGDGTQFRDRVYDYYKAPRYW